MKIEDSAASLITEEKVECISPETLITRYNLDRIDWLQIDTEGYDYEIIKMFNIEKTKPCVIVYENLHLPEEQKKECREMLEKNGYRCRDFGPNSLAVLDPPECLQKFFA